ncbi:MAG TPA: type II secretion system protein, partial [Saprospiraceae bacterium]|nr:type II secretion system protein [Saprospiraceae bacterium]
MRKHAAFTMLELIFVIIVMGIIGKFGVEFLAQAYKSFIFANVNNELQSNSETAVEIIAARLQHRIKDSVIARAATGATPVAIADASGTSYKVLEWIGYDDEGFRGNSAGAI